MDKVVNELYKQIKNFEKDYDTWEKNSHEELRKYRKKLFISLVILFLLIIPFVVGVIECQWGIGWAVVIFLVSFADLAAIKHYYDCFDEEFQKVPTKFDTVCEKTAENLKNVYGDNVSKFIDLLISDLTNKKATTLKGYDNIIKAVTSLPTLVATTALAFLLKGGFESNFSHSNLNLIFGISLLILFFKAVSYGIVSTIKNPSWGKHYQESTLLKILQVVKYEVLTQTQEQTQEQIREKIQEQIQGQ